MKLYTYNKLLQLVIASQFTEKQCNLFDNFGLLVQLILALTSFSVLILKKILEKQKARSWKIWLMDASKQMLGASFAHFLNLVTAQFIGVENGNPCKWYLINIATDVLIGTFISYVILKYLDHLLMPYPKYSFVSGDYGYKNPLMNWLYQVFLWLIITAFSKIFLIQFMFLNKEFLDFSAEVILSCFKKYPKFELVVVMVLIPTSLNAFQFWVTDSYLQKQEKKEDKNQNENSMICHNSEVLDDLDEAEFEDRNLINIENYNLMMQNQ